MQSNNLQLQGVGASKGIAFGTIAFLHRNDLPSSKSYIDDSSKELERFRAARHKAIAQLGDLYENSLDRLGEQNAVLFQIHQLMLDDPEYIQSIEEQIVQEHANAEYAVLNTAQNFVKMFEAMDNDYMQGRASDVMDVSRRVIEILLDECGQLQKQSITSYGDSPLIIATDDLAPSETIQFEGKKVAGIITSHGSERSHTVIFAKTMGMPSIIGIGSSLEASLEGHFAIIDGNQGLVIVDPDEEVKNNYLEQKRRDDVLHLQIEKYRGRQTYTASGRKIKLYANIGSLLDLDLVLQSDAEGIGLFRSEYIYLNADSFPSEELQFEIYKKVLTAMGEREVIIRTLDIGADKVADYFMLKQEDNPAMGMRAIRYCLSEKNVFKTQLRALYRASAFGNLSIMFPLISSAKEVQEAKKICAMVQEELRAEGHAIADNVNIGIMIETPAAALISDELAPLVSFFSIGSNDLIQFTLAMDRQNADLSTFLEPYHQGVIKLIAMTIENAHKHNIWCGVCGEIGSDDNYTQKLLELGIDEFSVVPSHILALRALIANRG